MFYLALACRCMTGAVFAVAAFGKLRNAAAYRGFAAWLDTLPVLSARARRRAVPVLVAVEVMVTVAVALPWTAAAGLLLAAVTLAVFAAGALAVTRRGSTEPCQCFGASSAPLGPRHVIRNTLAAAVAAVGAVGAADAGPAASHPLPVMLSVGGGLVLALLLIFIDDIAALFSEPLSREARP